MQNIINFYTGNIFPKPDKDDKIFLNEEQIQMFEKHYKKYEKYKNKKFIILKKRAGGFMYILNK